MLLYISKTDMVCVLKMISVPVVILIVLYGVVRYVENFNKTKKNKKL